VEPVTAALPAWRERRTLGAVHEPRRRSGSSDRAQTARRLNSAAFGELVQVGQVEQHSPSDPMERDAAFLHEPARVPDAAPRPVLRYRGEGNE
jgi:hypothetical protein